MQARHYSVLSVTLLTASYFHCFNFKQANGFCKEAIQDTFEL